MTKLQYFWPKAAIWDLKRDHGSIYVQFCFDVIIIPFRLLWMHFEHGKKQNSDFPFLAFPLGYIGGLRWRWGLKTHFKYLRAYLFKRGQVKYVLTMANLKLKSSLFTPRPIVQQAIHMDLTFSPIAIYSHTFMIINFLVVKKLKKYQAPQVGLNLMFSKKLCPVQGWIAGKCLISGPDTLRPYKQENRNGGKFLSVDLCSLRSYS